MFTAGVQIIVGQKNFLRQIFNPKSNLMSDVLEKFLFEDDYLNVGSLKLNIYIHVKHTLMRFN